MAGKRKRSRVRAGVTAAATNQAATLGLRVVVVGDPGTGKSSLIIALTTEQFPEYVPGVIPPTCLPANYFPHSVPITIIDTASARGSGCSPEQKAKLLAECKVADAVVLTYACDQPATLEGLGSFWLPELRRLQLKAPVIVVGCKLDLRREQQVILEPLIATMMQSFHEIETCIECSAHERMKVSDVFYHAQKAVLHPTAPLFDQEARSLKPRCIRALKRIFVMCDQDHDAALSDIEVKYVSAPLEPTEILEMKRVVQEKIPEGVNENGLTLVGFLFLHTLFIEKGQLEKTWTILKKFGYDNDLNLRDELIAAPIKRAPDKTMEMTNEVFDFLRRIFNIYDIDNDGALLPAELDDLFSTENPWSSDIYKDFAETNVLGGLSLEGFLCKWAFMTLRDPATSFANLVYVGYQGDFGSAFKVISKRQVGSKKQQTQRNVFQCYVFGARGSGKTSLLQSFIRRELSDALPSNCERFATNTVELPDGTRRILIMQEIREGDVSHLLENMESLAPCDVAVFVYDSSDEYSWQRARHLLRQVAKHEENSGYKVPCLIVASKTDLDQCSLALQESTVVSQEMGIETPICVSVRLEDLSNIFCRIVQVAEHHCLSNLETEAQKQKKIWDECAETLFCTCYVDLLSTCQDTKMLSNQEKFTRIAQKMFDISKRRFTHKQLGDKFKRIKSLYKGYMSQEMRTSSWWEKKQREDAKFRNIRNGEAPRNLELMKIIFEAEESTAQGESEPDYSGQHDLFLQKEESNGLIENLMRENEAKTKECQEAREFAAQMETKVNEMDYLLFQLNKKIEEIEAENQKLFNEVQELKGNIRVYCRIRPFLPGQNKQSSTVDYIGKNGDLLISNSWKEGKGGQRMFKFNKVFSTLASQAEVFSEIQPLIRSVLDGFDVCIFAYGQSGSGKTYTMSGPSSSKQDWGVNYRALNELFDISLSRRNTFSYEVAVQMVEIYNEQVRDLLSNDIAEKGLEIRSTSQPSGLVVPHASLHQVRSTSHVLELMEIGQANRAVGSTALNERSSRSHSILTVHVKGLDLKNGSGFKCCLHLIDLAGSERLDKIQATGDRLKEAQNINKSLSALGDVISALAKKSSHVPYRNSKLTQLLQSSLGGQAKTLMFVQINPEVESYYETISTLKFAERVSGVELGAARSNKEVSSLKDDGLLAGDNASDDGLSAGETESFTSDRITDMATDRMHEGPSRKTRFTLKNGQPAMKRSKLKDSVLKTPGQLKAAPSNLTRGSSVRGSKRWQ